MRDLKELAAAFADPETRQAALDLIEDAETARRAEEQENRQRRRADAARIESEQRYRTLFESIDQGFCTIEVIFDENDKAVDYRFLEVNPSFVRQTGLEDAIGRTVREFAPKHEEHWFEAYGRVALTGEPVRFENHAVNFSRWYEVYAFRIEEPDLRRVGVLFNDITVRKETEQSLALIAAVNAFRIALADGLRSLSDPAEIQAVAAGVLGKHLKVNRSHYGEIDPGSQIIEIRRDYCDGVPSIAGQHPLVDFGKAIVTASRSGLPLVVADSENAPDFGESERAAFAALTIRAFVALPLIKDGLLVAIFGVSHATARAWTDVEVKLIEETAERTWAAVERARAEADLREAKEAAELANQAKDRFLAVLSHELRTPLTPVLMAVASLEHDPDLRPDVREDMAMAKRNIELETKLIDDLLDLNRIVSGKLSLELKTVDLNETVQQVCGTCQAPAHAVGVQLESVLDPGVGVIRADAARLQQILLNVVRNAIKFTPTSGRVTVTTKRLNAEQCEVRVRDTGIGMSPGVLARVFEAFEQGHEGITRQYGGLGLGLAISKALADCHGGSIRAESEGAGKGSTFIIELPALATSPTPIAPSSKSAVPQRLRLLLVEDHADTARMLRRELRKEGFTVLTAPSVNAALAVTKWEPFDLLISDIGLPDGKAYDLMRQLGESRRVPGIAMSGYGMDEDIRLSREAGFCEHLVKPIQVPQLVAAIRRVTENRD